MNKKSVFSLLLPSLFLLAACAAGSSPDPPQAAEPAPASPEAEAEEQYRIVTLLPRDAIPAIDNPVFLSADEADEAYEADELVLGVAYEGDARAYSVPLLSSHEIVNDTVGGRKIAVTW